MYQLVLTVCSLVQGAQCRELPAIPLEASISPMTCVVASQIEGAKWISEHPNFYLHRMTCEAKSTFRS
jgi:hypothetical protein